MSTGLPIAFCLSTVAIVTALIFEPNLINMLLFQFKDFTLESGKTLICIPLFIFMGFILHCSGIAKDLFDAVYLWAGGLRGGLGMGTILICAIMAAMIGVSSAATLSMGIIAVPAMLSRNYDKKIATGIVQAGGALGFLIPPSIMMIMYAFVAQESVGRLFAAGLVPGLMLASMYMIYIGIKAYAHPELAPALPPEERGSIKEKVVALKYLILPSIIIFGVLGCIFTGITSPTEAAALGAAGAIISAAIRRTLTFENFKESLMRTLSLSGFNAYIILGAIVFSSVYSGLGASNMIRESLTSMNVNPWVVVVMMQLSFFFLGMFLDDIAILFLCMPIYVPIIKTLGLDPVWFAVLYVMNMQMAYITPPYGLNLFYMKAVAPKEVTLSDIYRSIVPFLALQAIALGLLLAFPEIALWLPSLLFDYFQMMIHPDLLLSKLDVLIHYPSLYKVLINNPQMLFDAGNMTNILSNTQVTSILFNNSDFQKFLISSPEFVTMLLENDWLIQFPAMNEFLQQSQHFLDSHQQIKSLMQ
ncbi:TRAP transporter large permease [Desulfosediminicola flagellatus]|uniref:TRAP transporter large permease n=1 Tax=Desulfosediminicola flagellatus TaxID=2569541 RepID=UPI001C3D66A6|nr:TRAP transporter large permease subunit [Desulfosediminicola flagellatus]